MTKTDFWFSVLLILIIVFWGSSCVPTEYPTGNSQAMILEAKVFPAKGQAETAEPQVLDYRYSPYLWQTCIGLIDDPHKSIVFSDGTICYDFSNGQYGTRIFPILNTEKSITDTSQRLWSPRVPIVTTTDEYDSLVLEQKVWAGAPLAESVEQWTGERVDYLYLTLKNKGGKSENVQAALKIVSEHKFMLNDDKTQLVRKDSPEKILCSFSEQCEKVEDNNDSQTVLFAEEVLNAGSSGDLLVIFYRGQNASAIAGEKQAGAWRVHL